MTRFGGHIDIRTWPNSGATASSSGQFIQKWRVLTPADLQDIDLIARDQEIPVFHNLISYALVYKHDFLSLFMS